MVSKRNIVKIKKTSAQSKKPRLKLDKLNKPKANGKVSAGKQKSAKKSSNKKFTQLAKKPRTVNIAKQLKSEQAIIDNLSKKLVSKKSKKKATGKPKKEVEEEKNIEPAEDISSTSAKEEEKPEQIAADEKEQSAQSALSKKDKPVVENAQPEKLPETKQEIKPSLLNKTSGKKEKAKTTKQPKAQKKKRLIVRKNAFDRCHKMLNDVKQAIAQNDVKKAQKLYLKSREFLPSLSYAEKEAIRDELNSMLNELSK